MEAIDRRQVHWLTSYDDLAAQPGFGRDFVRRREVHKRGFRCVAVAAEGDAEGFRGAAACLVGVPAHRQETWSDRREAQAGIEALARSNGGLTVYAADVGAALSALYPQPWPPDTRIKLLGGEVLEARVNGVHWRDSLGLLPFGQDDFKREICGEDWEEAPLPTVALGLATWLSGLAAWAREHGTDMASRVGTLAVNSWLATVTQQHSGYLVPRASDDDNDWGRRALYPGRAECYEPGYHERVRVYDVNSMYPRRLCEPVLDPRTGYYATQYEPEGMGFVDATVRVPVTLPPQRPPLPWRSATGQVYYPTGKWRATFASCELDHALRSGAQLVAFHGARYYQTMPSPFLPWVETLYRERQDARHEGNVRRELFAKLVLNSLWGRLALRVGQQREVVRRGPADEGYWQPVACGRCADCRSRDRDRLCWRLRGLERHGDYWLRPCYSGPLPDYVNHAWAAWMLARARLELGGLMRIAALYAPHGLIRAHTDSVTVDFLAPGRRLLDARLGNWLGDLKLEYDGEEHTYSANAYQRGAARAAGIPREYAERYLAEGHAEFARRRSILSGLSTSTVGWWDAVAVAQQGDEPSRAPNGQLGTRPWEVEELEARYGSG